MCRAYDESEAEAGQVERLKQQSEGSLAHRAGLGEVFLSLTRSTVVRDCCQLVCLRQPRDQSSGAARQG